MKFKTSKKHSRFFSCLLATAFAASSASASSYYIATTGSDNNAGTKTAPWATLKQANSKVVAGDTVWIRGGTYYLRDTTYVRNDGMSAGVFLNKSGESDSKRIHYLAYPGEVPVFDGSNLLIGQSYDKSGDANNVMYTSAFLIQAQYLHIKGIEICNVPIKYNSNVGMYISRSKHIFVEQVNSHHNSGAGFFVNERGTGSAGGHYFLNCDSHDNYDPNGRQGDGENADGFGVHYQTSGDTTKFYGCRAWWNSDDGWDLISQEFPVVIENSYAMGHGYASYGTVHPKNANGNGFKAGSSQKGTGRHIIRQCYAWKNYSSGFYANHSSVGNYWYNNTSYQNLGTQFNMWASFWDDSGNRTDGVILTGDKAHVMKNNIAFPNKTAYIGGNYAAGEYNTWNLNITPTESDFISVADPSMTTTGKDLSTLAGMLGPRKADGSLPDVDFLKLKSGSQMIDKGINIGLAYYGKAPDLGAHEYGLVISSSSAEISSSASVNPIGSSSSTSDIHEEIKYSSSSEKTDYDSNSSSDSGLDSSNSQTHSSSSENKTALLKMFSATPNKDLTIFDMQGRVLGHLEISGTPDQETIQQMVRKYVGQPGVFLIKKGSHLQRVQVR